jgi:hypothetical protein
MKTGMLEGLVERAAAWPAEAQAELLRSALDIELRYLGAYPLSDEDRAALALSAEDVRQGRYASDEQVAAVFARYGE